MVFGSVLSATIYSQKKKSPPQDGRGIFNHLHGRLTREKETWHTRKSKWSSREGGESSNGRKVKEIPPEAVRCAPKEGIREGGFISPSEKKVGNRRMDSREKKKRNQLTKEKKLQKKRKENPQLDG